MSNELIAMMTANASAYLVLIALAWRMYALLRRDLEKLKTDVTDVKERLARIEGWIQGRFREGEVAP